MIIFVVLALGALIGIAAWATETGRMWQVKSQLQAIADSAALAGVGNLLSDDFQTVDPAAARTAATSQGPQHNVLGDPLAINLGDVDAGSWDLATRTFTPLPGSTDPDTVRAVRVRTRRDPNANGPVPTILGRAVGVDSVDVNTEAVGYWGFAGSAGPGVVDLPIAIDCCAISGKLAGIRLHAELLRHGLPEAPEPVSARGWRHRELSRVPFDARAERLLDPVRRRPSLDQHPRPDGHRRGRKSLHHRGSHLRGQRRQGAGDPRDPGSVRGPGRAIVPGEGVDTNSDGIVDSWVVVLPVVAMPEPGRQLRGRRSPDRRGLRLLRHPRGPGDSGEDHQGNLPVPDRSSLRRQRARAGGTVPGALSATYPVLVD